MRVVNSSMNRKFGVSVNDVHSKLNKSMNKITMASLHSRFIRHLHFPAMPGYFLHEGLFL